MVRSPVTLQWLVPVASTPVLLKVMVGWFATSRKSALRRCPSRSGSAVVKLAASMVASTEQPAESRGSKENRPLRFLKWPRTIVTIMRSEEHTSELQSQSNLVCRLLLEKKKKKKTTHMNAYTRLD